MRRLNPEQFRRARYFLKADARPLDRALFEHRFENAPLEHVTAELARYQNDDSGFGRALEPDVRTPSSSALATGIALTILKELECSPEHPMVTGAVQYLRETFDERDQVWRVIPCDANYHPHAPWWHDEDGSLARAFDDFLIIPRAQIVGLLHHYSTLVSADWLHAVTEDTVATAETLKDDAFAGGGDTLRYALDLLETAPLPHRFKDRLAPRLRHLTDQIVCRDPEAWSGYLATPLKLAPSPGAAVADLLGDDLQTHLDYVIDHQTPEGTWEPTWTWGDFYPDVWDVAKREWRGHLTLETLSSLRAFGRVDL
ncbi:MAG: hypothetical protein PVG71_09180 [Anaerolineae bacterium]|jgi:hypothetical protein